jgi:FkbM family methyltransferase
MISETLKNAIRTLVPRPVRNSLRSPSRSGKYVLDLAMHSLGVRRTLTFPDDGWSVKCHPHAHRYAYESQILDRDQNEEFRAFRSSCTPQMLLFDIGAHFGIFSLAAARIGGSAVAVDPSPLATRMSAIQSSLNGFSGRIQVIRAAVGSVEGSVELLSSGAFSYGYFKAAKGRLKQDLTEVPSITIDTITRKFGPPTHIKIDVEGYEEEVLGGAQHTLSACSPILFLELHNEIIRADGGNPHSVLAQLTGAGYTLHSLIGADFQRTTALRAPIVHLIAKPADSASSAYDSTKHE